MTERFADSNAGSVNISGVNLSHDRMIHWIKLESESEAYLLMLMLYFFLLPADISTEKWNQSSGVPVRCKERTKRKSWLWRWLSAVDQSLHTKLLWYQEPKRWLLYSLFLSVWSTASFLQLFVHFVHSACQLVFCFPVWISFLYA